MKLRAISEDRTVGINPFSPEYVNPDTISRAKGVPFYFGNGRVYYGQVGQIHGDVLEQMWPDDNTVYSDADSNYLSGRVSEYGGNLNKYVSFWNTNRKLYDAYFQACLQRLRADGLIDDQTLVSTPLHGTVPLTQVDGSAARQISSEEEERVRLAREMHTMTGQAKQDAMKKLGVGGGGKPHAMQTALRDAGLNHAGQKWWAATSESVE